MKMILICAALCASPAVFAADDWDGSPEQVFWAKVGHTFDDWSTADTVRESAYMTVLGIDCLQSRNMARRYNEAGHSYSEANPLLLSDHPTVRHFERACLLTAIAHATVAVWLPPRWRERFQYVTIAIELPVIAHNASIGLRIEF